MVSSARDFLGIQPSTVSTSDSVLVIIDAQNEYINGKLACVDTETSSKAIRTVLDKFRSACAPIIHVVHRVAAGAPIFTPDTPLAEIFDILKPLESESIVFKPQPGSFTGTNLQELIQKTGRNKVVLVGYMAHVCISTTARQAAERGYEVVVLRDAVGDRDISGIKAEQLVDTVMKELADFFGTVLSVKDVQ